MKFLITLLLAFISLSTFASVNNHLTPVEEKGLLKSIDNICGDTWCEGDFNYNFVEVRCPEILWLKTKN